MAALVDEAGAVRFIRARWILLCRSEFGVRKWQCMDLVAGLHLMAPELWVRWWK